LGGGIIRVAMRGRGDDGKVLENLNGFGCHFGPFRYMEEDHVDKEGFDFSIHIS
jgi:hypothetical protein